VLIGKPADFVIAKIDPLHDIRSLENRDNIVVVMKGGDVVKDGDYDGQS